MAVSKFHFYSLEGAAVIEGSDSAEFLQGQFSQDLRIAPRSRAYGLWLNPKGKILGDSFLLKESETAFRALSYFSGTEAIRSNLEDRIIMDDVETRSAGDWSGVSLWGDAIDCACEWAGAKRPSESGFEVVNDVYVFWGRRSIEQNLELVSQDRSKIDELKQHLHDYGVREIDTVELSGLAIREGRFEIGTDILNSDLPQEVHLGEDAVAYDKGCYIGQEVMARLKSMGRPRRSLESVSLSSKPNGEGPWSLKTQDGSRAGELRRVVGSTNELLGSAMLKRSVADRVFIVDGQDDLVVERERR